MLANWSSPRRCPASYTRATGCQGQVDKASILLESSTAPVGTQLPQVAQRVVFDTPLHSLPDVIFSGKWRSSSALNGMLDGVRASGEVTDHELLPRRLDDLLRDRLPLVDLEDPRDLAEQPLHQPEVAAGDAGGVRHGFGVGVVVGGEKQPHLGPLVGQDEAQLRLRL
jgi:hypothetical protein